MTKEKVLVKKSHSVAKPKTAPASSKSHLGGPAPAKVNAGRYFEAIGRRKTAIARVRVYQGKAAKRGEATINDRGIDKYFPIPRERVLAIAPFDAVSEHYSMTARVEGGGQNAQAEAVRLGVARALVLMNPEWRSRLKALGFLKRDPRMVERKKYGSRKARRPQQWRKR